VTQDCRRNDRSRRHLELCLGGVAPSPPSSPVRCSLNPAERHKPTLVKEDNALVAAGDRKDGAVSRGCGLRLAIWLAGGPAGAE
jgi:hypothetical protein